MKQHITKTQLSKLSSFGKGKLRKWLDENRKYKKFPYLIIPFVGGTGLLPLLSIGQMIEFLGQELSLFGTPDGYWAVDIPSPEQKQSKELVDALWEAVKEVLK